MTGTATVAAGTWRDFVGQATSGTTVTIYNIGGGNIN